LPINKKEEEDLFVDKVGSPGGPQIYLIERRQRSQSVTIDSANLISSMEKGESDRSCILAISKRTKRGRGRIGWSW
jgi:hypothetical protein